MEDSDDKTIHAYPWAFRKGARHPIRLFVTEQHGETRWLLTLATAVANTVVR